MVYTRSITPKTIINLFKPEDLANVLASSTCIRQRFDDYPVPFFVNQDGVRLIRALFDSGHDVRDAILNYEERRSSPKYPSTIARFFKSNIGTKLFKDVFSSADLPESLGSVKITTLGKYKGSTIASALDDLRDIQQIPAVSAGGQASVTDVSETLFSASGNSGTRLNADSAAKK